MIERQDSTRERSSMLAALGHRAVLILLLAITAAVAAYVLQPKRFLADERVVDLEAAIPLKFADWRIDPHSTARIANPAANALMETLYSQVVERAYISATGERIMLSIAYGRDQRDGLQVHRPEFCYQAQGYQVSEPVSATIATRRGTLSTVRLITRHGTRSEPLTYWTTLGNHAVSGPTFSKRKQEVLYAAQGVVADGLVFRVSSIDTETERGFTVQSRFLQQLIAATDPTAAAWLAGLEN